jgi:hypothetical protein
MSLEEAKDAVDRVEQKLREGYRPAGTNSVGPGALIAAAKQAVKDGVVRTTGAFLYRIRTAEEVFGIIPDYSLYRSGRYSQPVPKIIFSPADPPRVDAPEGAGERILVIGDLHQDPAHPDRVKVLTQIARYASKERFERVIQVGDWSTWNSCSGHDRNDTMRGRLKPTIKQDQENLQASLAAWRLGIAPDYKPRQSVLMGNHEYRVERFEDANPEAAGIHTGARDQAFAQFGWRVRPYGEIFYVEGVGFTHHPVNGAGRAYGGKTGPQRAANDTCISLVGGHTHRFNWHQAPKIGPAEAVSIVEVGCALPYGVVEPYAKHSSTGWSYGVVAMSVCGGQITDLAFVSMLTLDRDFSM